MGGGMAQQPGMMGAPQGMMMQQQQQQQTNMYNMGYMQQQPAQMAQVFNCLIFHNLSVGKLSLVPVGGGAFIFMQPLNYFTVTYHKRQHFHRVT